MKKFFKILRKIIKILLVIILFLISWVFVIITVALIVINNRTLKFYENEDGDTKFTMNKDFKVEDGSEIKLSLNEGSFLFNDIFDSKVEAMINVFDISLKNFSAKFKLFEDTYIEGSIKVNLPDKSLIKNLRESGDNFLDILQYCFDGDFTEYYDNGQIARKGQTVNGLEDGYYVSYYENGQIEEEGNYKGGEKNGYRVGYYKNGNIHRERNYKDGSPDGTFTGYFGDGSINFVYNYKNGKLNGKSFIKYDNGFYEDIEATDGILNGITYDKNNNTISKRGFIQVESNDLLSNGEYIGYGEDGKILKGNYINGRPDGLWAMYYANGSYFFKGDFKNGSGIISYFDEDGNLIGTGEHIYTNELLYGNGVYNVIINGLEIKLYDNGQIKELSNYSYGNLNGAQTGYYKNGQIASICNYSDGPKDGPCSTYYENGQVREIGEYEKYTSLDGYVFELGKYSYYDKDGNFVGTGETLCSEEYSDRCLKKRLGFYYTYYPSYKIHEISYYTSGGVYTTGYFENGNIEYIDNPESHIVYYENGNLKTKSDKNSWVEYFENGQIYCEGNYDNGKKVGTRNRYLGNGSIGVSKNYDE